MRFMVNCLKYTWRDIHIYSWCWTVKLNVKTFMKSLIYLSFVIHFKVSTVSACPYALSYTRMLDPIAVLPMDHPCHYCPAQSGMQVWSLSSGLFLIHHRIIVLCTQQLLNLPRHQRKRSCCEVDLYQKQPKRGKTKHKNK